MLVSEIGCCVDKWSPMQTEESQPEGKRIMLAMRFIRFLALPLDSSVGISRSAAEMAV